MNAHITKAIEEVGFSSGSLAGRQSTTDETAAAAETALGAVAGLSYDQAKQALQIALKAIETAAVVPTAD